MTVKPTVAKHNGGMDKWGELDRDATREVNALFGLVGLGRGTDWVSVYRRAESIMEIVRRAQHHAAMDRAKAIGAFAMAGHSENEPR